MWDTEETAMIHFDSNIVVFSMGLCKDLFLNSKFNAEEVLALEQILIKHSAKLLCFGISWELMKQNQIVFLLGTKF